jgi:deoxyribodipyrimidine photo-lyase
VTDSRTALVVLTRDLRLRDHPALFAATRSAERVVPLFVFDDVALGGVHASPNRVQFLLQSLEDLRGSLRAIGADLVVRSGDWATTVADVVARVGAESVHVSHDVSAFARRRTHVLSGLLEPDDVELHLHPGVTVLPPGATTPSSGSDWWKVFTPYFRSWSATPWRTLHRAPTELRLPDGIDAGELPSLGELVAGEPSPHVVAGGETEGLERLRSWAASELATYDEHHDDLAGDRTSHISAHLHLGCLSPLEVATRLRDRPGGAAFVRQLCWRDFYHQVLAARPETATADVRVRGDRWRVDDEDAAAWREGRTGYPIVDAAMAQLRAEGFMHNRARMIVASFLTKDLHLDWRLGAAHFMELLVDGDLANNQLNWQWTAGTGTDTNPNRIFNPTVQSTRFDPEGTYLRRYLPALADVPAPEVHDPTPETRRRVGYPPPLVDHHEAIAAYRAALAEARGS